MNSDEIDSFKSKNDIDTNQIHSDSPIKNNDLCQPNANIEDEEDLSGLETLIDMFPSRPRTELIARLKSSKLEKVVEEIFREQDLHSDPQYMDFNRKVNELEALFPHHSDVVLSKVLKECDEDLEKASDILLKDDVTPEKANSPDQWPKKAMSQWELTQKKAEKLQKLTSLPKRTITSALHKNMDSFVKSLIELIDNYKPPNKVENIISAKITIPSGGRVQGAARTRMSSKTAISQKPDPPYVYDENSLEAKELKSIYFGNPQLKCVSEEFLTKCLVFYKGDVAKVVIVATIIIEDAAESATYKNSSKGPKISEPSNPGTPTQISDSEESKRNAIENKPVKFTSATLNPKAGWNSPKSTSTLKSINRHLNMPSRSASPVNSKPRDVINFTATSSVLDLHSYTVSEAIDHAREMLRHWWERELAAREIDGRLHKYGTKAAFIDPIQLITGRGLHSTDGIARIRKAIKAFLARNNYLFEENTGYFLVVGKKYST